MRSIDSALGNFARGDALVDLRQTLTLLDWRQILQDVARSPTHIDRIAAQSIKHDNGFVKLVVWSGAGVRLRLHVWEHLDQTPVGSNIHSHRWDFASRLILGSYIHETYAHDDAGQSYNMYEYQPVEPTTYRLVPLGSKCLTRIRVCDADAGSFVELPATSLHRTRPRDGQLTASLFLNGPVKAKTSFVYNEMELLAGRIEYAFLTATEVIGIFRRLLELSS